MMQTILRHIIEVAIKKLLTYLPRLLSELPFWSAKIQHWRIRFRSSTIRTGRWRKMWRNSFSVFKHCRTIKLEDKRVMLVNKPSKSASNNLEWEGWIPGVGFEAVCSIDRPQPRASWFLQGTCIPCLCLSK